MNEQDSELQQLSSRIGAVLKHRSATVTTAESCTGGWIAKAITDIADSSLWFRQGVITYSDNAKQQLIGVNPISLYKWGAVSEQVVREMAQGALQSANADFSVAVSGIAGPAGGSTEQPVGTVWFAFATVGGALHSEKQSFSGERDAVRCQATMCALRILHDIVVKD